MDLIDVSTRVGWPVYAGLGLLGAFLVWVLVAPDRAWRLERSYTGWQYRDGHRIELSTAGRLWVRFWTAVSLVGVLVFSLMTVHWSAHSRVKMDRSYGETVYYVGDAVESPGCTVRVFACLRSDDVFPIEVEGYQASDPVAGWPDDMGAIEGLPEDVNLLLYVDERFFPTHVVIGEGKQVTVSLYGKCAPKRASDDPYGDSASDCADHPTSALVEQGVVPVTLEEPLGDRDLIDGDRDAPVERATRRP